MHEGLLTGTLGSHVMVCLRTDRHVKPDPQALAEAESVLLSAATTDEVSVYTFQVTYSGFATLSMVTHTACRLCLDEVCMCVNICEQDARQQRWTAQQQVDIERHAQVRGRKHAHEAMC